MILFAILTGAIAVMVWRGHTRWWELMILGGWGLLAATTPIGHVPAGWLAYLSGLLGGWF